ncbi:MAG: VOC family protein [Pseudomonadales bacterium]|jgi:catechol 2,3-dioxygenase-like lactoylglutathione lyase family enzyme|nr:VOC family protein [Pseudomonadales bacterium]
MQIRSSAPHLFVSDVPRTVDWFVDVLGFERPTLWGEPPEFAMPQRDGFIVMVQQCPGVPVAPHGDAECWDAYFWVKGLDPWVEEIRARGADIAEGPVDRPDYGMRELTVRSPDGHLLVFAEDIGEGAV